MPIEPPLGCDMLLAMGQETLARRPLLAKNSDRHHTECQHIRTFPAADHPAGSKLKCQYLTIPQVAHTHAMLGFQPFWLWGFEHGVNEHGVAIGNEAIWMKAPRQGVGLMGMDFVRLGLERGSTAREALDVITNLLETHGQGGSARFWEPFGPNYDNSFFIVDPSEAWVLETCGREWVARRVRGRESLSNVPTTADKFDLACPSLLGKVDFNFARDMVSPTNAHADGRSRHARSSQLLAQQARPLTPADMMGFLRDRGAQANPSVLEPTDHAICMHPAAPLAFVPYRVQSVASMVVDLAAGGGTVWCAQAAPDVAPFLPFFVDIPLPAEYALGTHQPAAGALWWRLKRLQTAVEADWAGAFPRIRARWDIFEQAMIRIAPGYASASREERARWVQDNFAEMLRQLAEAEREFSVPAIE